jgi:hypothetical protein
MTEHGTHLEVVPDQAPRPLPAATPGGMPTPAEWQMIEQVSTVLAGSDLAPKAYRGKPANVILAALAGRPFGWDPTMSMRSFHIIEGVPSMKPEIMLALIRRAGHSVSGETSSTGATVTGTRADTGDTMTYTFDQAAARDAGLLGKAVWKQYAASMYWARALAQLARMLFPDVVLGAGYTPEELGARISDDDVIDVELVDGIHQAPAAAATVTEAQAKNRVLHQLAGDVDAAKAAWITRPAHLRPDGEAWAGTDSEGRGLLLVDPVERWANSLEADTPDIDADVLDAELVDDTELTPEDAA